MDTRFRGVSDAKLVLFYMCVIFIVDCIFLFQIVSKPVNVNTHNVQDMCLHYEMLFTLMVLQRARSVKN